MNTMTYQRIAVERLTPHIGAEISGVDLSKPVDSEIIAEIRQALLDHLVVFFRDQDIDPETHKAFARQFGELHAHPGAKLKGNTDELVRIYADEKSKVVAGERWHSDLSCAPLPPMGSILHMHVLPSCGGDTQFCSAYAAYDSLSDRMKVYLEGLTAHHDGTRVFSTAYVGKENADKVVYPKADHPVIIRHPETGRKLLYVNPEYTIKINELSDDESLSVLNFLYGRIGLPQHSVRFRWRKHSIAFWDNRSSQHVAVWDYFPETRLGLRAQVKGVSAPAA